MNVPGVCTLFLEWDGHPCLKGKLHLLEKCTFPPSLVDGFPSQEGRKARLTPWRGVFLVFVWQNKMAISQVNLPDSGRGPKLTPSHGGALDLLRHLTTQGIPSPQSFFLQRKAGPLYHLLGHFKVLCPNFYATKFAWTNSINVNPPLSMKEAHCTASETPFVRLFHSLA